MQYELKRFGVWSVAKLSFVLGALLGFLLGLFVWMISGFMQALPLEEFSGGMDGLGALGAMGAVMPFFLAVFYGVTMMIANAIMAAIFNLLASFLGGIELTLAPQTAPAYPGTPAPAWSGTPPVAPPGPPAPPPPPTTPPAPGTPPSG